MSTLTDQVRELLIEEGFTLDKMPEDHSYTDDEVTNFQGLVHGKHAEWLSLIRIFEKTQRLVVYSLYPEHVPEARLGRLMELITRINYGLILGNFEMDLRDGEIRYKTSIDLESIDISPVMIRNLVFGNFFSVDLYFYAIQAAIHGEQSIDQLVYEAEHPQTDVFELVDEAVH